MTYTSATGLLKKDALALPSALTNFNQLFTGKTPALFMDYDGCLCPIVKDPDKAFMSDGMRKVVADLAEVCFTAVVSGRDRQNVKNLVQLDNLYFAGSHGFDISGPDDMLTEPADAKEMLPALDEAERILQEQLQSINGALVERKRYAIAVHYRNVEEHQVELVKDTVINVLHKFPVLKEGLGKKVLELKPNLDWNKGKAVLWLLEKFKLNTDRIVPVYIGDDITDEDAFAALQGKGIGILVGEHDQQTAATYRLESVEEVQTFLEKLLQYQQK